ncbi:MAG: type III-B CRISPR module-associated Cmr3 family protein [Syntrophomonadaceae bacterium]|nr:type III-B CRISPR module-associated Cmr3 family protein [Syntrophomonadaceae bacterium]
MKYLVTLKPLAPYFFGNEKVFGYTPGKNEQYIVHSNLLPQQTSILGMLRKEILTCQAKQTDNNFRLREYFGYSAEDRDKMNSWIGPDSFSMKDSDDRQDFGLIYNISPCFLINTDTDNYYLPLPFDHQQEKKNCGKKYTPLKMNQEKTLVLMDDCREINLPDNYKPKNWEYGLWWEINRGNKSSNCVMKESSIFTHEERIGIKKIASGPTERESFFKYSYYNLRSPYRFAFIVELGFELPTSSMVFLGGERSVFAMQTEETDRCFADILLPAAADRVILWSDTWLGDNNQFDYIDFTISQNIDFRNMQDWKTTDKTKDKKDINATHRKVEYKYSLLQRGSVLYTKEPEKLRKRIASFTSLVQIGYNIAN